MGQMAGAGAFVRSGIDEGYRLPTNDVADLPDGLRMDTDDWKEVWLKSTDEAQIERVWAKTCVPAWRAAAGLEREEVDRD
jgi:hypothetical protein